MGLSKYQLKGDLIDLTYKTNEYLLDCLLLQNKTNDLEDLEKEYYQLCRVPKVKETKEFPSEEFLYKNTIGFFEDSLMDALDEEIELTSLEYDISIPKYNKHAIYECIIDYYKWVIPKLSKEGIISYDQLVLETNKLIEKYNKLKIDLPQQELFKMANLSTKRTGLDLNIWSDGAGAFSDKKDKQPRIMLGIRDKFIVSLSLDDDLKILSKTRSLNKSEEKKLEEARQYILRNLDLFIKHYNSSFLEYDDDDLTKDLRGRNDYN